MPRRAHIVIALTVLLAVVALAVVRASVGRAVASREAQVTLAALKADVTELQGLAPTRAQATVLRGRIERELTALERTRPVPALAGVRRALLAPGLAARRRSTQLAADAALRRAARQYAARAGSQQLQARSLTNAAIVLLLAAFVFFYLRSDRAAQRSRALAEENARLASASRLEALTDALTGLPNRRALMADLELQLPREDGDDLALVLLDLDGFKQYNDRFGHIEGDALLARLGSALAGGMHGLGTAYRLGGDEFCVVAPLEGRDHASVAMRAALALSETGVDHAIGTSVGVAVVPAEANEVEAALRLADARLYDDKAGAGAVGYELNSRR